MIGNSVAVYSYLHINTYQKILNKRFFFSKPIALLSPSFFAGLVGCFKMTPCEPPAQLRDERRRARFPAPLLCIFSSSVSLLNCVVGASIILFVQSETSTTRHIFTTTTPFFECGAGHLSFCASLFLLFLFVLGSLVSGRGSTAIASPKQYTVKLPPRPILNHKLVRPDDGCFFPFAVCIGGVSSQHAVLHLQSPPTPSPHGHHSLLQCVASFLIPFPGFFLLPWRTSEFVFRNKARVLQGFFRFPYFLSARCANPHGDIRSSSSSSSNASSRAPALSSARQHRIVALVFCIAAFDDALLSFEALSWIRLTPQKWGGSSFPPSGFSITTAALADMLYCNGVAFPAPYSRDITTASNFYEARSCTFDSLTTFSFTTLTSATTDSKTLAISGGTVGSGTDRGISIVFPPLGTGPTKAHFDVSVVSVTFSTDAMLRLSGTLPVNSTVLLSQNLFTLENLNTAIGIASTLSGILLMPQATFRLSAGVSLQITDNAVSARSSRTGAGLADIASALVCVASDAISFDASSILRVQQNTASFRSTGTAYMVYMQSSQSFIMNAASSLQVFSNTISVATAIGRVQLVHVGAGAVPSTAKLSVSGQASIKVHGNSVANAVASAGPVGLLGLYAAGDLAFTSGGFTSVYANSVSSFSFALNAAVGVEMSLGGFALQDSSVMIVTFNTVDKATALDQAAGSTNGLVFVGMELTATASAAGTQLTLNTYGQFVISDNNITGTVGAAPLPRLYFVSIAADRFSFAGLGSVLNISRNTIRNVAITTEFKLLYTRLTTLFSLLTTLGGGLGITENSILTSQVGKSIAFVEMPSTTILLIFVKGFFVIERNAIHSCFGLDTAMTFFDSRAAADATLSLQDAGQFSLNDNGISNADSSSAAQVSAYIAFTSAVVDANGSFTASGNYFRSIRARSFVGIALMISLSTVRGSFEVSRNLCVGCVALQGCISLIDLSLSTVYFGGSRSVTRLEGNRLTNCSASNSNLALPNPVNITVTYARIRTPDLSNKASLYFLNNSIINSNTSGSLLTVDIELWGNVTAKGESSWSLCENVVESSLSGLVETQNEIASAVLLHIKGTEAYSFSLSETKSMLNVSFNRVVGTNVFGRIVAAAILFPNFEVKTGASFRLTHNGIAGCNATVALMGLSMKTLGNGGSNPLMESLSLSDITSTVQLQYCYVVNSSFVLLPRSVSSQLSSHLLPSIDHKDVVIALSVSVSNKASFTAPVWIAYQTVSGIQLHIPSIAFDGLTTVNVTAVVFASRHLISTAPLTISGNAVDYVGIALAHLLLLGDTHWNMLRIEDFSFIFCLTVNVTLGISSGQSASFRGSSATLSGNAMSHVPMLPSLALIVAWRKANAVPNPSSQSRDGAMIDAFKIQYRLFGVGLIGIRAAGSITLTDSAGLTISSTTLSDWGSELEDVAALLVMSSNEQRLFGRAPFSTRVGSPLYIGSSSLQLSTSSSILLSLNVIYGHVVSSINSVIGVFSGSFTIASDSFFYATSAVINVTTAPAALHFNSSATQSNTALLPLVERFAGIGVSRISIVTTDVLGGSSISITSNRLFLALDYSNHPTSLCPPVGFAIEAIAQYLSGGFVPKSRLRITGNTLTLLGSTVANGSSYSSQLCDAVSTRSLSNVGTIIDKNIITSNVPTSICLSESGADLQVGLSLNVTTNTFVLLPNPLLLQHFALNPSPFMATMVRIGNLYLSADATVHVIGNTVSLDYTPSALTDGSGARYPGTGIQQPHFVVHITKISSLPNAFVSVCTNRFYGIIRERPWQVFDTSPLVRSELRTCLAGTDTVSPAVTMTRGDEVYTTATVSETLGRKQTLTESQQPHVSRSLTMPLSTSLSTFITASLSTDGIGTATPPRSATMQETRSQWPTHRSHTYDATQSLMATPSARIDPTLTLPRTASLVPPVRVPAPIPFVPSDTNKAIGDAVGVVSVTIGGAIVAGSVQQGVSMALVRMANCYGDDDDAINTTTVASAPEPLDLLVHPLRFGIGDGPLMYHYGAVLGNMLLVPLAWAVLAYGPIPHCIRWLVSGVRSGSSEEEALMTLGGARDFSGWPGNMVVPLALLSEGSSMAAVHLLTHGGDGDDGGPVAVVIGAATLLALIAALCAWVYVLWGLSQVGGGRGGGKFQQPAALVCYRAPDLTGLVARVMEARWEWALLQLLGGADPPESSRKDKGDGSTKASDPGALMAPADRGYLGRRVVLIGDSWWLWASAVSYGFSLVVGAAEGMPSHTSALCRSRWSLACVGAVGQTLALLCNPIPLELGLMGVTSAITCVLLVLVSLIVYGAVDADDHGALGDALNAASSANAIIGIVLMVVGLLCTLLGLWRERARLRRGGRTRELRRALLDADNANAMGASGVDGDGGGAAVVLPMLEMDAIAAGTPGISPLMTAVATDGEVPDRAPPPPLDLGTPSIPARAPVVVAVHSPSSAAHARPLLTQPSVDWQRILDEADAVESALVSYSDIRERRARQQAMSSAQF